MGFKYVVVRTGNREVPIMFPDSMVHASVVTMVKGYYAWEAQFMANGLLGPDQLRTLQDQIVPVSAGEIRIDDVWCGGRSETLKLESRGEADRQLIRGYPYFHGMVGDEEEGG